MLKRGWPEGSLIWEKPKRIMRMFISLTFELVLSTFTNWSVKNC